MRYNLFQEGKTRYVVVGRCIYIKFELSEV